jgi:hypothetical protein
LRDRHKHKGMTVKSLSRPCGAPRISDGPLGSRPLNRTASGHADIVLRELHLPRSAKQQANSIANFQHVTLCELDSAVAAEP